MMSGLPILTKDRSHDRSSQGQMTIEFALLFPVMLMIALIACNSILFLSACSSFDRTFRESACVFAPSPASDQERDQICAQIKNSLASCTQEDYLSCEVKANTGNDGLTTYEATLSFTPTIFGAYPLRRVFDIELAPIQHAVQIAVDTYRPGVFL